MRCYCCNNILTTQEATRRFKESNSFTDMCTKCLNTIDDDVETVDSDIEFNDEEQDEE